MRLLEKGEYRDNVIVESLFASLKLELVRDESILNLGYISPVE